jgi:hypothetical protein
MELFFTDGFKVLTMQRLNISRQFTVAAIAERAVLRVLASAPRDGFRFGNIHFARPEAGAFVRAVAKRLFLRRAACAPPKSARLGFLNIWRSLGNNWFTHGGFQYHRLFRLATISLLLSTGNTLRQA